MDKVIQIANICKDMCNVPNPIPGRIYYPKGCAPALNTCGGGEKTDVFMDKAKVTTPPTALCTRTHQRQWQRAGQPHIILSRQPILRMCHRQQIHKPRNMDNRTIKLTNLIQSGKYYDLRHAIYWSKGCAPTMTAAMGMGGGFVPLLVVIK